MHMIEAIDVTFIYPDGRRALDGIDLKVEKGSCIGLVGANGAGKSTFVQLLFGLMEVTAGTLKVAGLDVKKENHVMIREKAGLLFQNPDDMFFTGILWEDIAFGPIRHGMERQEAKALAERILSELGVLHLLDRQPFRLSGGERHMAALAVILAMDPQLIVLDEPTAGLDPKARRRMIEVIGSTQTTRLIVGHDLDMMLDICDGIIVLENGKTVANGTPQDILTDAALMDRHGLELPLRFQTKK